MVIVLGAAAFAGAGAASGRQLARCRPALVVAVGLGVLAGVGIAVIDAPDGVTTRLHAEGALVATALVAGTGVLYVALGALLHRRHLLLVALIVCSIPLLVGGAFGGLLIVADLALCAPDAYECPG